MTKPKDAVVQRFAGPTSRSKDRSPDRKPQRPLSWLLSTCLLMAGALPACASVPPWKRETLARRDMASAGDGRLLTGEEHARAYREGSSGGASVQGGGCGCN